MRRALVALALSGCAEYLEPGALGVLRHFGHVRFNPPAGDSEST
jgi:hypothetical protein